MEAQIKETILKKVIGSVRDRIAGLERELVMLRNETKEHKEGCDCRPNIHDTFIGEAQEKANFLNIKLKELYRTLSVLEATRNRPSWTNRCSLVEMQYVKDGSTLKCFLSPVGEGVVYETDNGEKIIVVSHDAPVGRALTNAQVGKEIKISTPKTTEAVNVLAVA
jgi:hypothetical protein